MVSKPKNAVGDRHLAAKSMHLATNLEFGRSHQMSVVACSNASSAECNISVYFFPVPSTRCAHHACSNLMYSCFHSNIHALRVFLVCISWIRVAVEKSMHAILRTAADRIDGQHIRISVAHVAGTVIFGAIHVNVPVHCTDVRIHFNSAPTAYSDVIL